jgi:hypothetical protein
MVRSRSESGLPCLVECERNEFQVIRKQVGVSVHRQHSRLKLREFADEVNLRIHTLIVLALVFNLDKHFGAEHGDRDRD